MCRNISKRLLTSNRKLSRLGDTIKTKYGPLTHIDKGSKILGVCHRDTVMFNRDPKITRKSIRNCPQLDDRLGLWVLMDYLPQVGAPVFDILITDSEEVGNSTAQFFDAPREYNWIFEFDRAGTDVVFYDYETDDLEDLFFEYGFETGSGSFTDICFLSHLGCAGFNIGTGYYRQHTPGCFAILKETKRQARRFAELMNDIVDVRIDDVARDQWSSSQYDPRDDGSYMWDPTWEKIATMDYYWIGDDPVSICAQCNHDVDPMDRECWYCDAEFWNGI